MRFRCAVRPSGSRIRWRHGNVAKAGHVGTSPHFSSNQMHWGIDSEKILLSPQLFSNPRNAPMPTECSATLFEFPPLEGRQVVASFDGGAITTDAGALLLGQTDRAIRLT